MPRSSKRPKLEADVYDKRSQEDTWALGRDHNIAEDLQISWFEKHASMNDFGHLGVPTWGVPFGGTWGAQFGTWAPNGLDNVQTTLRQRLRQRFGEFDRFRRLSKNRIRQLGHTDTLLL